MGKQIDRERNDNGAARRVLVAAGGTGGHIAPALAVGTELRRAGGSRVAVRYVTGSRATERQVFEGAGEFPDSLSCDKVPSASLEGIGHALRYGRSFVEAWRALDRFRPHAVLATGGYVCAPVLLASRMRGIPYFLHESNAIPGRVTRLFAGGAARTFVAHDEAAERLDADCETATVGTPVRRELIECTRAEGLARYGFAPDSQTLLVLGGSQGARGVNDAMCDALSELAGNMEGRAPLNVIWACGPLNLNTVRARVESIASPRLRVELFDYIADIRFAYAAADLVVSRAGASSLAEIGARGLPSILIPYPHAADNHQEANARSMAGAGAALVLDEAALTGGILAERVGALLSDGDARAGMGAAALGTGSRDCAEAIARELADCCIPHVRPRTTHPRSADRAAA